MKIHTATEFEYVSNNSKELKKYLGKWIAVLGTTVVESDTDLQKVWDSFHKKYPSKIPFIMKVAPAPMVL